MEPKYLDKGLCSDGCVRKVAAKKVLKPRCDYESRYMTSTHMEADHRSYQGEVQVVEH